MKYKYLEDEIALSEEAPKMLAKAKEQEKEKLKQGYVYVTLKQGLKVLTPVDENGKPKFTKEQLLQKYKLN